MKRDLKNNIGINVLLESQDLAHTDTKSAILDTAQFPGVAVAVAIGELTGVDGSNYVTPVLQESDTTADTAFTTVAATDIEGAFTKVDAAAEDSVIQYVGYKGGCRYIRALLDYTGTGITAGIVGVYGIVGRADAPTTAPAPVAAT